MSAPEPEPGPADLRATGSRIESLLDAAAGSGPVVRERAEELVRLVVDLYGAGLERILEILDEQGHLDDDLLRAFASDDLVASLLLVHGLHPEDVVTRVDRALDRVRPYLSSHGGDVELVEVNGELAHLRLHGSCDGCASSTATLSSLVEGAVLDAAPELTGVEVDPPTTSAHDGELIPIESLLARRPAAR